jgi:hypothetical protein
MDKKIRFKDLSLCLKIAVIAAWAYLFVVSFTFCVGFLVGLFGA